MFKTLEISEGLINPGLNIFALEVKSITVDSNPILQLPPSKINFKEPLNSLATSLAETGLIWVDLFALGIAKGKFKHFNIFRIVLFLGILLTISGALYFSWTVLDWELTPYLPDLKSNLSKNKFQRIVLILGPVVFLILTFSILKIGYADLENAPSSYFSADNTIYFGK